MDIEEQQVDVGRYLRFVVAFLFIVLAVLGVYEYYYGSAARGVQNLQQQFNSQGPSGAAAAATSTP